MGQPHNSRQPAAYPLAAQLVGRSELAASSEPLFGVPMADRDWRTPCKAMKIAGT
ncbi:hypothetical protein GALL_273320 [mine drainage metagenome]|uniref:Uncharacterized protein n=1 Tax=mine drainage metagenome TaxID=410659 RepID=A0A1J5RFL3_9ZZZZ